MVVCIRDLVLMFLSSLRMSRKIAMKKLSAHAQSRQADIVEKKKIHQRSRLRTQKIRGTKILEPNVSY